MRLLHSKEELLTINSKIKISNKLKEALKIKDIKNDDFTMLDRFIKVLDGEVKIQIDRYNKFIGMRGKVESPVTGDIRPGRIESIDGLYMDEVYVIFIYDNKDTDLVNIKDVKKI